MQPDLAKLRAILAQEESLQTLFALLPTARVRANTTGVRNLVGSRDIGPTSERNLTLLNGFRLLESCGFGRLIDATRHHRSRFVWAVAPGNVVAIASNPNAVLQPHHLTLPDATLGDEHPAPAGGGQRHIFHLRPDADAIFTLPTDLTASEARRVGHYILSLVTGL